MKHAQSAPALAQDAAAGAGGFQAIQYGTEIELEFDREVYPIGVSLADASIVGITQHVMRPQQAAAGQVRSGRVSCKMFCTGLFCLAETFKEKNCARCCCAPAVHMQHNTIAARR
jgi:hypothetical protein